MEINTGEIMGTVPYVVTNDLSLVFDKFEVIGKKVPSSCDLEEAGQAIQQGLKRIFPKVEIVESERISGYLLQAVNRSDIPVVSLTGLLNHNHVAGTIECSRSVELVTKADGFFSYSDAGIQPRRIGVPDIKTQFNRLVKNLDGIKEVALADDVIFSGGTILNLVTKLNDVGISVKKAYGSIILEKAKDKLAQHGIEIEADFVYEKVVDEVCMRDFIIGAPDGGRNVLMKGNLYASAPYAKPFGDIEGWASIPNEHAQEFSDVAVQSSLVLWTKMDALNGDQTLVKHLSKPVIFWQEDDKVVDSLHSILRTRRINGQYCHTL